MKQITCPVNGARPISEFICWGETRPEPPDACSDDQWAEFVFDCDGPPGSRVEWWCHRPSNIWFLAQRDIATGHVHRTWLPG